MNDHRQQGSGMISDAQLKARLRELGGLEPPHGLRERLAATIPGGAVRRGARATVSPWPRALGRLGIAAGIVVLASVAVRFLAPLPGPARPIADTNDWIYTAALADQNHPLPRDINCCDSNVVP